MGNGVELMSPAPIKNNTSPAAVLHATNAGRTSGVEELIVMVLISFSKYRSGLRDLERLGAEVAEATTNIRTNREEDYRGTSHDNATDDRPLNGLETAVVQHELLDLIQHFQLLIMSIPILPAL
jgi:hypothetical protein